MKHTRWKSYIYGLIAGELSLISRYYDRTIHYLPRVGNGNVLFDKIDCPCNEIVYEPGQFPDVSKEHDKRTAVLLDGVINHHLDIQGLLQQIAPHLSRTSRILIVAYNPYLSWLYRFANRLGIRKGELPSTFVTRVDLENIARIAGFSVIRTRLAAYSPWHLFGFGSLLNRILPCIPLLRWLGLVYIATLRPAIPGPATILPSLSCVIPARNERGTIESCITRFPDLGCKIEIIFVEGHSTDGTWEEILRVKEKYAERFDIKAFRQSGKGKGDAVRLGFSEASGELLTILDADLTMPPELLGRFYNAYIEGHADFINGSRLVYPMEGNAMKFLNWLGNIFFAKTLSWVLDIRLGDSLCGTKLLASHDYQRIIAWRNDFGDFDPFGDFELLFPAATLGLGIIDIPIRYRDRTYGATNISRFRHGMMLLRMTLIALIRIKLGFSKHRGSP